MFQDAAIVVRSRIERLTGNMSPYDKYISEVKDVLTNLIKLMSKPEVDMKLFRNIAAVYVIWQQELQAAQLEALNYSVAKGK